MFSFCSDRCKLMKHGSRSKKSKSSKNNISKFVMFTIYQPCLYLVPNFIEIGEYAIPGNTKVVSAVNSTGLCDPPFMLAVMAQHKFCLITFYLPNGDVYKFPTCNSVCCSTTCGMYKYTEIICFNSRFFLHKLDKYTENIIMQSVIRFILHEDKLGKTHDCKKVNSWSFV